MLKELPESERWLYEQVSIQGQYSKWLVDRSVAADAVQDDLQRKVADIQSQVDALQLLRVILGAKWKVIVWLASALAVPVLITIIGAYIVNKLRLH